MLRVFYKKRGQSTIEYATLIIIVLGAFLAVQNYAKRGLQGRWKQAVDQMGDQYDPRYADTDIWHRISSNTDTAVITTNATGGYWTTRTDVSNSVETKTGYSTIGAY